MTKFHQVLIIAFISIAFSKLFAQDSSKTVIWFDISFGFVGMKNLGTMYSGELRLQNEHQLIALQAMGAKEISFTFPLIPISSPIPQEEISSFAILYGRTYSFHLKRMLFPFFPFAIIIKQEADYSIFGLIGVATFDNLFRTNRVKEDGGFEGTTKYFEDKSFKIGIPIQIELVQKFSPEVGYVHRLYYHLNSKRETWGFQWGIQVYFNSAY